MDLENGEELYKITGIIKTIYMERPLWFGYIGADDVFLIKHKENEKTTILEKYNLKMISKSAGNC